MKNDLPEVLDKSRFSLRIKPRPEDIDELGHVNNVVYIQWVQEVASTHWNLLSNEKMRSANIWVALRHEIDYVNPTYLDDEVDAYTWVSSVDGAKSNRHVHFYSKGKCLARAMTTWCLLNAITFKPKRISEEVKALLEM